MNLKKGIWYELDNDKVLLIFKPEVLHADVCKKLKINYKDVLTGTLIRSNGKWEFQSSGNLIDLHNTNKKLFNEILKRDYSWVDNTCIELKKSMTSFCKTIGYNNGF